MDWNGKFIRGIFSEESGLPSFGRVMSFIHGIFGLGWLTVYVWFHHIVPDAATLSGVLAYVLGPYAVNKTAAVFMRNGKEISNEKTTS